MAQVGPSTPVKIISTTIMIEIILITYHHLPTAGYPHKEPGGEVGGGNLLLLQPYAENRHLRARTCLSFAHPEGTSSGPCVASRCTPY